MTAQMQRVWQKPELIVLVRGSAEEAVLGACKHAAGEQHYPNDQHHHCAGYLDYPCVLCSLLGSS